MTRRDALTRLLFGGGLLGLRSLATGLPMAVLANPARAFAAGTAHEPAAQYVILASSGDGDPVSCNVPGTYLDKRILHSRAPAMAATSLRLRGQSWTAAKPWAHLQQPLLDRMCFFHHATNTVVHSDEQKVMRLGLDTDGSGMLPSLLAGQLAPTLGTVQSEPVVLGPRLASEALEYERRPLPVIAPSTLAEFLGAPTGPLGRFTELRDRDLDRINAYAKQTGNKAQVEFVDRYAQSQAQLRRLSDSLLSVLQSIKDDGPVSQVLAAITLIRMKVAPVVSIHIPFGGDNHQDLGLARETQETVAGVATIGRLWHELATHRLEDRVSFLSLNVFGRPLSPADPNGRDHNSNHNVAIMFGPHFRGGVVGGVTPMDNDYGATSIDSRTGGSVHNGAGDISFSDTMSAMAMTFTRGVGVDTGCLGPTIAKGKVVRAAVTSG